MTLRNTGTYAYAKPRGGVISRKPGTFRLAHNSYPRPPRASPARHNSVASAVCNVQVRVLTSQYLYLRHSPSSLQALRQPGLLKRANHVTRHQATAITRVNTSGEKHNEVQCNPNTFFNVIMATKSN